jgi:putative endonuclease
MVAQATLTRLVMVRIHVGQPFDSGLRPTLMAGRLRPESNALSLSKGQHSMLQRPSNSRCRNSGRCFDEALALGMTLFPAVDCPLRIENRVWVYIVQSADGSFYVGQSRDVQERLRKHHLGLASKYTAEHRDLRLVYCEGPLSLSDAVAREQQLKGWSRAKKIALIIGDTPSLRRLSQSRSPRDGAKC